MRAPVVARRGKITVVKPASDMRSDINITPLVDVVLVLLIIFMVMTPLMTQTLSLQLPVPDDSASTAELAPGVVRLAADGALRLEGEPLRDEDYVPRLRAFLAARPEGQRGLLFEPDPRAPYSRLVAALDGARRAGAEALGLSVDAP
ncbi:biopolymer transporter ExbD [Corallococcus sp. H22C18031201]|nr:biopolymer transporter ExbD [Corallococcus sp. H22C18031201]